MEEVEITVVMSIRPEIARHLPQRIVLQESHERRALLSIILETRPALLSRILDMLLETPSPEE